MIFDWFNILNVAEFQASGFVSKNLQVELEGVGLKDILITQGNELGVLYEGTFLIVNFDDQSPFVFEGHAVFLDEDDNLWLGILNEA